MCRYLTANGLCAASDGAVTPFPLCEFFRRGREFCQCVVYREYMTELYLHTQYVYDADSDSVIESLSVEPDKNDWEREYYLESPF